MKTDSILKAQADNTLKLAPKKDSTARESREEMYLLETLGKGNRLKENEFSQD